ncbi:hypothetical protein Tcan_16147 [Toxocara canis]|uniref:Uncharacterized protein n=1 Tax=Toxocara canis TaxID=6265 RepID=A0A0B2VUA6_TOXCA|nr:hypothetical protein Tcan_16147 [Toxocara canis]
MLSVSNRNLDNYMFRTRNASFFMLIIVTSASYSSVTKFCYPWMVGAMTVSIATVLFAMQCSKRRKKKTASIRANYTPGTRSKAERSKTHSKSRTKTRSKTKTKSSKRSKPSKKEDTTQDEGRTKSEKGNNIIPPQKVVKLGNIDHMTTVHRAEMAKEIEAMNSKHEMELRKNNSTLSPQNKHVIIKESKCKLYETENIATLDDDIDEPEVMLLGLH